MWIFAAARRPRDGAPTGRSSSLLRRLGIGRRATALKLAAPHKAEEIDAAHDRLTNEEATGMGTLFKAIGFSHPKLGPLPCF
jgi:SAM-dependent MidA family methyltransferase